MKPPKLIWRFEDHNNEGIYRHAGYPSLEMAMINGDPGNYEPAPINPFLLLDYDHMEEYTQDEPTPMEDELYDWVVGYHWSGFASITQARHWFDHREDLEIWTTYEIHLVAYLASEADGLHVAEHQAIFHPRRPEHCVRFPADYLYQKAARELEAMALAALLAG